MFYVHVALYPTKFVESPIYPTYQVATMGAPKSNGSQHDENATRGCATKFPSFCDKRIIYPKFNVFKFSIEKTQQMVNVQLPSLFPKKKSLFLFPWVLHSKLYTNFCNASTSKKQTSALQKTHRGFLQTAEIFYTSYQMVSVSHQVKEIHLVFSCDSEKSGNFKHIWYIIVYQFSTDLFQKPTSTAGKHHLHWIISTIHSDTNPVKYHVAQCRFKEIQIFTQIWRALVYSEVIISFHFRFTTLAQNQGLFLAQRFKLFMADLQGLHGSLARKYMEK